MRNPSLYQAICMVGILCQIEVSITLAAKLFDKDGVEATFTYGELSIILTKAKARPRQSSDSNKVRRCEGVGREVYEPCIAKPKSDLERCLREYDKAVNKCVNPTTTSHTKLSEGTYRIPYANGTKVHINRNFYDHNPVGKIDMAGRGKGPYRVVAAAAGRIRYIEDSRSKQQHPMRWLRNTDDCLNNYVWIEHDNGEWSKYSHLRFGTTTTKAGLKVGDYVKAGRYLGDEGKVGCAWPAHLHFEVVKVRSPEETDKPGYPTIADSSGKLTGYKYAKARNPRIGGIDGETLKDGKIYFAGGASACKKDADCGDGKWCNAGADFTKNVCLPLKNDNETCALVGGGHQCKGGKCKFSRCYTSKSVAMGGTCYVDDACKKGKCSDIDGAKGMCVCKKDSDCDSGEWCDAGLDTKINRCYKKLKKGQSCGKVGSVGNNHKCKSGKCSGFPKYECK